MGAKAWRALAVLSLASVSAAAASKKGKGGGPLCHEQFRSLEKCIGNDYERLRNECGKIYQQVQGCLGTDWQHIDDERGYKRAEGSFNRMRRCRHGVMLYNPMDWYIGRGLEVYGEWGEKKVQMWERIVKAGHVAVDIGAHVGALTLPLSRLVGPSGRVIAFEPFYPSFSTLAANVGLNSLQNVELRQAIVSDRMGRVFMNRASLAFTMTDFFNFGSMNYNGLRVYNHTDDVERPSTDWDEYQVMALDQLSLARLDFVKVDAEAMELSVLVGAQRMIKKFKPLLYIEYRNPWEKETGLLEYIRKKMRYECVLLRIPIFNAENFRGHAEDIWGGGTKLVSFNLLCKHRWWEYPDMDEAVLELFDTAVDTDIEGLRTTALSDPFEALALADQAAKAAAAAGDREGSGGAAPKAAAGAARRQRYEDMTLEELLDGEPVDAEAGKPPGGASSRNAARGAGAGGREELSLDDLLGPETGGGSQDLSLDDLLGPDPSGGLGGKARTEELSLDDLLALDDAPPAPRPAPRAGGGSPKAAPKAAPRPAAARGVQDMTLDDLLGPDDGGEAGGRAYDDMTLDELLGPEPARQGGSAAAAIDELLGGPAGGAGRDELSLDELLGLDDPAPAPAPKPKAGPGKKAAAKAPTKAKAPGPAPPGGGAAKASVRVTYDDELTLDEL